MPKERRTRTVLICGAVMLTVQTALMLTAVQFRPAPLVKQTELSTEFTQALLPTLSPQE